MNERGGPFQSFESPDTAQGPGRSAMTDSLQQALRSLGGDRGSAAPLSPEALTDIMRRAGLSGASQVADIARIIGMNADGASVASIPQELIFALQDVECTLPAETVQGVERITDVTPVPNTVPWVQGVIHLRGAIISVVDLRGFFGMPTQPLTPRSRLLVVSKREMTIGLMVDAVTEMRTLDDQTEGAQGVPTPEWATPYAQHTIHLDGRTIIVLDVERLLFAEKMHRYRADLA
ncbi:MAG: chemotaxis protein CheW [Ktedonobacterales bacterium]